MSLSAEAAMLFRETSGSCRASTNRGTAPASTTCWASSVGEGRRLRWRREEVKMGREEVKVGEGGG